MTATALLGLGGCDQLGIEAASAATARKEAESKAVGGACRHAARSIEQCYQLNKRADRAAVFAGWREMNDYMRENKIDAMPPPPETQAATAARAESESKDDEHDDHAKPAAKGGAAKKGG